MQMLVEMSGDRVDVIAMLVVGEMLVASALPPMFIILVVIRLLLEAVNYSRTVLVRSGS